MARPVKKGLDYYTVSTRFMVDPKVRAVLIDCGSDTIGVLISILGQIYADNGYYIEWDEESKDLSKKLSYTVSDEAKVKRGSVIAVINAALNSGFFDRDKYEQYKILTSKGIQDRYAEGVAKRTAVKVNEAFVIVGSSLQKVNSPKKGVNSPKTPVSDTGSTQIKGEEIRGEDIKLPSTASTPKLLITAQTREELLKQFKDEFGRDLSPMEQNYVDGWPTKYNCSFALISCALKEAVDNQAYSLKYMNTILLAWNKNNIKTVADYETMVNQREQSKLPVKPSEPPKNGPDIPLFSITEEA
jgi:DnaD/phage-associated family protein